LQKPVPLLINPRAGAWARGVVHGRIELLRISLLNRLPPPEKEGMMNSASKRCRWYPGEMTIFHFGS
jgi:hypothetical protein